MAHVVADNVCETSTTTGTGTYTLSGALAWSQTFGAAGMVTSDTCYYRAHVVDANGNPTGDWEVGLGTYNSTGPTLARTAVLQSSNSDAAVSWSAGTRYIFITTPAEAMQTIGQLTATAAVLSTDKLPVFKAATSSTEAATVAQLFTAPVLPSYAEFTAIANPSTPGAGLGRMWARLMAGRCVPKWMGPSGVDYPLQSSLWGNQVQVATPATGTTAGSFIGGSLTSAGTVSHPTPSNTNRATGMRRIRHANIVTTTNQVLGFHGGAADMAAYCRGNGNGPGGFFLFARFSTALWAANTCRIFVGLRSGTTAVVASDTLAGNLCGFWHDTTVGGTTINFVTRDGTTANTTAITVPTLAADVGFDAYIYCPPQGSTIYYRLDSINDQTTRVDSSTTSNLPTATTFMAPECAMSNGTANITVTTVAMALNRLYIEADY